MGSASTPRGSDRRFKCIFFDTDVYRAIALARTAYVTEDLTLRVTVANVITALYAHSYLVKFECDMDIIPRATPPCWMNSFTFSIGRRSLKGSELNGTRAKSLFLEQASRFEYNGTGFEGPKILVGEVRRLRLSALALFIPQTFFPLASYQSIMGSINGYLDYKRREYCNDVKCPMQSLLDEEVEKSPKYEKIRTICASNCMHSTYEFHHWLTEKGYLIVRPK